MTTSYALLDGLPLVACFLLGSVATFLYTGQQHSSPALAASYMLLGASGLVILITLHMDAKRGVS